MMRFGQFFMVGSEDACLKKIFKFFRQALVILYLIIEKLLLLLNLNIGMRHTKMPV